MSTYYQFIAKDTENQISFTNLANISFLKIWWPTGLPTEQMFCRTDPLDAPERQCKCRPCFCHLGSACYSKGNISKSYVKKGRDNFS